MNPELDRILTMLETKKLRATYGAVAKYLRVPQQSMGNELGRACPRASWVVGADTGMPKGYFPTQIHPDLKSQDRIIRTENVLRQELVSSAKEPPISNKSGKAPRPTAIARTPTADGWVKEYYEI
jgi:hypothetical protein